jgi:tRNA pseudouridine38-40 synthase
MVTRLDLEYDGGAFAGWAAQPGLRTVEGELSRALSVLLRGPVAVTVAGRTDAGVHALRQVASFEGSPVSVRSLNALLPADVAVLSCTEAPPGWSARFDATSRAYCYRLLVRPERSVFWARRALWWPRPLDFDALCGCASALVGTHDFTAFTPTETDHVRFTRDVFSAEWRADGDLLEFWIEADAFMRHMNRVLVGTMLEVASGRRRVSDASERRRVSDAAGGRSVSDAAGGRSVSEAAGGRSVSSPAGRSLPSFEALLAGQPRSAAGPTVPPHGLYLAGVGYDGVRVLSP